MGITFSKRIMARVMTTSTGQPADDNQNSLTAGTWGPLLLQDFHLIDKISHFDRERIPERVVHAKGGGAHGTLRSPTTSPCTPKPKSSNQLVKKLPVLPDSR